MVGFASEKEYRRALRLIEKLLNAKRGSAQAKVLEKISKLVADYEDLYHSIN